MSTSGTFAGDPESRHVLDDEVARILTTYGIEFAGVAVVGHAKDVAAIAAPPAMCAAIASVSQEIKALGVRYVTIELDDSADD